MTATTDATTRPYTALAVESARAWLTEPEPTRAGHRLPDPIVDYFERGKAAVRALIHELEAIAPFPTRPPAEAEPQRAVNRAGIAQARQTLADARLCPGGGTFVDQDKVDGNCITGCPVCFQHRPAHHVNGRWWAIGGHRARHAGACLDDDGTVDACVCGLEDRVARIHAAATEAGHATETVRP